MSEQPKIASPELKEEEQGPASPTSVHNNEQSNDTLEPETIHEKVEQKKENDVSEALDAEATKEEQEKAKPNNDAQSESEMRGRAVSMTALYIVNIANVNDSHLHWSFLHQKN